MVVVQRGIVFVCDGKGDLGGWIESPSMRALGHPELPARVVYLGPAEADRNVTSGVPFSVDSTFPRDALEKTFRENVNALRDAQTAFELAQKSVTIAPSTLIIVLGRAGDPATVEYLTDVAKFLHRLVDRYFPQQSFTWSAVLMLPNLFSDPTGEDFGRTYAVLKQVDGYQQDPPPFKTVGGEPVRLFDTIWLANSLNELGGSVGRFPEAGEALSTFLRAVFNGAVDCSAPPMHMLLEGKRPNFSSFGCTVLSLDRKYMGEWLMNRLDHEMIPPYLVPATVTLEATLARVKQCMTQSAVSSVQQHLTQDGGELFQPIRLIISPENVLSAESLLTRLSQQRGVYTNEKAYDSQLELQKRISALEETCVSQLRQSAGTFADEHGLRAGEQFLNLLANDPPEESDSPSATANFTLFNLLGGAIDRLDEAVGYTAGAEQIRDQRSTVKEAESEVVQARRERDVCSEEARSLQARREKFERLPEEERASRIAHLNEKVQELGDAEKKVRELEEQLSRERATLRGLLIARRNYRRDDRQGAYIRRTDELEKAIDAAAENYRTQVTNYRKRDADRQQMEEERRSWVWRRVIVQPALALLGIILLNALTGMFVGFSAIALFYGGALGMVLPAYAVPILAYAIWTGIVYWRKFVLPIRAIKQELKNRLEQAMRAANATVEATNARLRFDFEFEILHASVKVLYGVRERARKVLEGVQSLLKAMEDWADAPAPAPPTNNLYRSSMWTAAHLEQVFGSIIKDGASVTSIFQGEYGPPSSWVFANPEQFREKLIAFGETLFKPLQDFTLEDFVFHPRYSHTAARDRLAALFEAAAPYLKLKADLLSGNTITNNVVFAKHGHGSRFAEEMQKRGIAPQWQEQADGDSLTVIRTRIGFPAFMLAEIDTYWIEFLRNPAVARCDPGEECFPELIPPVCRALFNRIVEAFLLLWFSGRIKQSNGEYSYEREVLGTDRLPIYDRLMNDPSLGRCLDAMYDDLASRREELLRRPDALLEFFKTQKMATVENEFIGRYASKVVGI